jgi:hypothetical protein
MVLARGRAFMWNSNGCNIQKRTFQKTEELHTERGILSVATSVSEHTRGTHEQQIRRPINMFTST